MSVVPTDDGYIFAGYTSSSDSEVHGHRGFYYDYWVVKLDINGTIQWSDCLGGSDADQACGIVATRDGGYVVAGTSHSDDGDVHGGHGQNDYWVVKLSGTGSILWTRALGGSGNDIASSLAASNDGGFFIAGSSFSNDSDVTGHHGPTSLRDFWVVKLDSAGTLLWQKSIGGSDDDVCNAVASTPDGGCVVAGSTRSIEGDVQQHNHGSGDFLIVKLDSGGTVRWASTLGGSGADLPYAVITTGDGGYVAAGYSESHDGDVRGNKGLEDVWVVKLDSGGDLKWEGSYGGSGDESANCVAAQFADGFTIAGITESTDGDALGNSGENCWLLGLDNEGRIVWKRTIGGSGLERANSIVQTGDNEYIVAGTSNSIDGDVPVKFGDYDCWIVGLGPATGVGELRGGDPPTPGALDIFPNPASGLTTILRGGPAPSPDLFLDVRDVLGRRVFRAAANLVAGNSVQLDAARFPAGIYQVNTVEKGVKTGLCLLRVVH